MSVWMKASKVIFILLCTLVAQGGLAQSFLKETFVLDLDEPNFGTRPVPVELWIPATGLSNYPLIITQHGSTRDGHTFAGGKGQTDVFSTRLMQAGVARGFAVAALDAFFDKGLSPSDKTRFPSASVYAVRLRHHLLARFPQLDGRNTFVTGFSYGADAALAHLSARNQTPWAGIVAAEAGCNAFHKPRVLPFPVLILKGSESHYYPRACQIVAEEHRKIGNQVQVKMFDKANHYFSLQGRITSGLAFNGCADNPVMMDDVAQRLTFMDGTATTWPEVHGRCFRREGDGVKTRERLDEAIEAALGFFSAAVKP